MLMNNLLKLEQLLNELIFSIRMIILYNTGYKKTKKCLIKVIKVMNKIESKSNMNEKVVNDFINNLNQIICSLKADLLFFYESDPAAEDFKEIVLIYPGYYAIIVYRIAHAFANLGVKYLPRMLSEYAHNKTGIDINPKAIIGNYFFIDHGTGVVIGETTVIGNHVKIYQNVTLGALSLKEGLNLKGLKRHPTIGNNVTIYAGATILGKDTLIEDGTTIPANSFIIKKY